MAWAILPRQPARGYDAARAAQAAWAVGMAMGTAAALAFVPTPAFPQYSVQPLAGLPVLAALAIRSLPPAPRVVLLRALPAAVVLMGAVAPPRLGAGLADLRHPDRLTPARLSHGAEALARLSAPAGAAPGPIATLSPIYPLQAGLPVYPEFATGPFAWRVADYIAPNLRASYVMAGPQNLERLFGANPPAETFLGRWVLLTGQTGFKGGWLAMWLDRLGADTRAVVRAVDGFRPELIVHMAAQAIVRDGYDRPAETFATNVVGTANVLEIARAARDG